MRHLLTVSRVKTQVYEVSGNTAAVRSADRFNIGDVAAFDDGNSVVYSKMTAIEEKPATFTRSANVNIVDKNLVPTKFMESCEIDFSISSTASRRRSTSLYRSTPGLPITIFPECPRASL